MTFTPEQMDQMIKGPNCGLNCPPDKPFSCGCDACVKQIKVCWPLTGEKEERFSASELEEIESLWINDETGYLGKDGCVLPRKYRPINCLSSICKYAKGVIRDTSK